MNGAEEWETLTFKGQVDEEDPAKEWEGFAIGIGRKSEKDSIRGTTEEFSINMEQLVMANVTKGQAR